MLSTKFLYFTFLSRVLTGDVISSLLDGIRSDIPENPCDIFRYIIQELQTAAVFFNEAYFSEERLLFKKTKDESLKMIFKSITAYNNGIFEMVRTFDLKLFPRSDYLSHKLGDLKIKRRLAADLYKDLCDSVREVDKLKFNVKLGRNDLEMLVINGEGKEFDYIKNFINLATAAKSILYSIEKFEEVIQKELTIIAESLGRHHDPSNNRFCLDIEFEPLDEAK